MKFRAMLSPSADLTKRSGLSGIFLAVIPPVSDVAHDRQGERRQIYDRSIECLGRFFPELLRSFRTNGTLSV